MDVVPKPEDEYIKGIVGYTTYMMFCYKFSPKKFMNKLNFIIKHPTLMHDKTNIQAGIQGIQLQFIILKTQLDKDKQHIAIQYNNMNINQKLHMIEVKNFKNKLYDK